METFRGGFLGAYDRAQGDESFIILLNYIANTEQKRVNQQSVIYTFLGKG